MVKTNIKKIGTLKFLKMTTKYLKITDLQTKIPFQIVPNIAHRLFKGGFCVPLFGTKSFQIVERRRICKSNSYKCFGTPTERFLTTQIAVNQLITMTFVKKHRSTSEYTNN